MLARTHREDRLWHDDWLANPRGDPRRGHPDEGFRTSFTFPYRDSLDI
jgi:hypothetical protein